MPSGLLFIDQWVLGKTLGCTILAAFRAMQQF
jgi:hypothetical protein